MAMTFYTNPMSRGRIARWALEETGAPYDEVIVPFGPDLRAPGYAAINPMAKLPSLVHDAGVVTEVAAIITWLADRFPEAGLMPEDRGALYRWMFFGAGPLEYAITNAAMGVVIPEERQPMVGYGSLDRVLATLRAQLSDRPWLCGDTFSAADLYLGSQVGFGMMRGSLPKDAVLAEWSRRGSSRPASQRAAEKDNALMGGPPNG